jgi:hypothetical protein
MAVAKKSLKIERKKKKAVKKTTKKRLVVKIAKLNRTTRKAKSFVRRGLKAAIKGLTLKKIPERLYRKIDAEIAKSDAFKALIDSAIVTAVNEAIAVKQPTAAKKVKKTAKKEAVAAAAE